MKCWVSAVEGFSFCLQSERLRLSVWDGEGSHSDWFVTLYRVCWFYLKLSIMSIRILPSKSAQKNTREASLSSLTLLNRFLTVWFIHLNKTIAFSLFIVNSLLTHGVGFEIHVEKFNSWKLVILSLKLPVFGPVLMIRGGQGRENTIIQSFKLLLGAQLFGEICPKNEHLHLMKQIT